MADEKRPEWMSSISGIVDPEDYLLGRKIDKTFELSQLEKAKRAREARIELISKDKLKLTADPVVELERRKQALKLEIISNPIKLKRLRDKLLRMDRRKSDSQNNSSSKLDDKLQHPQPSSSRPIETRVERRYPRDTRDDRHQTSRKRRRSPSPSSSSSSSSSASSASSSSSSSSSSSRSSSTSSTYSSSSSAVSRSVSSTSSSASSNHNRKNSKGMKASSRYRPSRSPRRKDRRRHHNDSHRYRHPSRRDLSRDRYRRSPRNSPYRKRRYPDD